jgi:hypothetical protein
VSSRQARKTGHGGSAAATGIVSDLDDALSVTPSDLSLVSDNQDTRTSAHDDQSRDSEGVLPRKKAKPACHPVFSFEDDLICLLVRLP